MKRRWIILIVAVVAVLVSIVPLWWAINNSSASFPSSPYNPYDGGGTWYKGQIHCHSTNSDGNLPPSEVISAYANQGFKFIALTDHETVTKAGGSGILVLGQEYGKGSAETGLRTHMNGINISSAPSTSASPQSRIDSIVSQGGIAILNHPTALFYAYSMDDMMNLKNYAGIEVYNAGARAPITGTWDDILSRGKMVWGFASDDSHQADMIGKGWIVVRVNGTLSTSIVINAIKHGAFYSSQGPSIEDLSFNGTTFKVSSPDADSISFYGKGSKLLKTVSGGNATYDPDGSEGYVRAEVSKGDLKAWTQPVFLGSKSASTSGQIFPFLAPGIASIAIGRINEVMS